MKLWTPRREAVSDNQTHQSFDELTSVARQTCWHKASCWWSKNQHCRLWLKCLRCHYLQVMICGFAADLCRRYLQRFSGHDPLSQTVQSPTVSEDHQLAEVGAGHFLLPVLSWAVDSCVLRWGLLKDTQVNGSISLVRHVVYLPSM